MAHNPQVPGSRLPGARPAGGPRTLQELMRRPARVGLAALLLVTLTIVTVNVIVLAVLAPDSTRSVRMLTALQEGSVAMVDQETGLRGFLITRDEQFLAPYREGALAVDRLNTQLGAWAQDDPELARRVAELRAAEEAWIQGWAQPTLQAQPAVADRAALTASLLQGKELFDAYRTVETGVQQAVAERRAAASWHTRLALAVGTVVGLLVAVAAALRVRQVDRRASAEIAPAFARLSGRLSDLAGGDVDRRLAPVGPAELRAMAMDVNTLSAALRSRGELVAAREEELVTARDEAERAGQAKTAFLATMSHEIRTPLNAVLGLTDLLLATELTELQRGHLETVSRSGDSLLTLINDVLDFSKIEAGELDLDEAPFDLEELVYDVAQLFSAQAATKGIDLLVDIRAAEGRQVMGDALRLRQVLMNLVSNAIKFTPRGHVVVRITGEAGSDGLLDVQIAVLDTGIGIPDEHRDRLFRSFSQVDGSTTRVYGGTGLGLAISQRIAQAMGGEITVDSEVGVGSTFTVAVPMGLLPMADGGARSGSLQGCRVLAVDDNPTNLEILEHQLTRAGASVVLAGSPFRAMELLSGGQDFDLCLTDQHMPGMSGDELARWIRRTPAVADLPLVLLSSLTTVSAGTAGLFAARLHKPVHPDRLLAAVGAALHPAPAAGQRSVAPAPGELARDTGLRVLVAEDHEVNAQLMELYLQQLGHRSERVADGRAAVDAVRAGTYDVVLMDAQMPVLGGADATAEIRALPGHQPVVIAVTASVLASDRAAFAEAGADDFLTKPVRLAVLDGALRALLPVRPADAPEPAAAGGPLDPEVVEELRDLGDEGFTQVYTRYSDHLDGWVADLVVAAARASSSGDEAAEGSASRLAHRLKGSSASLGATHLAALCQRVEGVDALEEAERAALLTDLQVESARVSLAVRELLAVRPVSA
jgi:signal transduction histidine kinase/DNA-binding response OmpR family regulator